MAGGHHVIATCLDPDNAETTRSIKGDVSVRGLDVSDHGGIEALAAELRGEPIDVLVSNAGIGRPHPPFGETDYAHWRRILEVVRTTPRRSSRVSLLPAERGNGSSSTEPGEKPADFVVRAARSVRMT
jgi:NAD(P)-dependent dehydrogenase (short-subunit alcohol dehydrogenase family)